MAKLKRKEGRPTLYRPEYCDRLILHCKKGLSYEAFAGVVDVCVDTLYEWEKVHPKFSEAKKRLLLSLGFGGSSKGLMAFIL